MAELDPGSGGNGSAPQTKVIGGNGQSVQSFTLDPGVFQFIESVYVEVDTAAAGDVTPTLFVKTDNGQVIATKRQGETIPAGGTGSATWALRLDDEGTRGAYRFLMARERATDGMPLTFSPIPGNYHKLVLELQLRVVNAAGFSLRFNGSLVDVYGIDETWISGNGGDFTNLRSILPGLGTNTMGDWFSVTEDEFTTDPKVWTDVRVEVPFYASSTRYKNVLVNAMGMLDDNNIGYLSGGGVFQDATPITSIQVLTANGTALAAGSRGRLYGVT